MKRVMLLLILIAGASFVGIWWWRLDRPPQEPVADAVVQDVVPDVVKPDPVEPAPPASPDSAERVKSASVSAETKTDGLVLPPELDGPPEAMEGDPVEPEVVLATVLERLETEANSDPMSAVSLASSLRSCARVSGTSAEEVVGEWRRDLERVRAHTPSGPGELVAERMFNFTQRARGQLQELRRCEGLSDPVTRYIHWLERAARVHPDPRHRERLRVEYVESAFDDMPLASDRIAAIDEAIRRRDIALGWLMELRDQGNLRAMSLYSAQRMRGGQLLAEDVVESGAWLFAGAVRSQVETERSGWYRPQPGRPTAAELWSRGLQSDWFRETSEADLREADRRGREIYLRLFGTPPA
jgi:hypothetical protein